MKNRRAAFIVLVAVLALVQTSDATFSNGLRSPFQTPSRSSSSPPPQRGNRKRRRHEMISTDQEGAVRHSPAQTSPSPRRYVKARRKSSPLAQAATMPQSSPISPRRLRSRGVQCPSEIDFEDHDVKQLWNFISVLATVGGMEDFQRAMGITEIHYFDSLSELHAFPKRNLPSSEEFVPTLAFVGSDEHSEIGGHFHFLRKTKEWSDSYKEVWQKGGTHGFCQIYAVMGALDEAGLLLPEQFSGKLKSGNGERRSRSSGHGHDISLESSAARHRIVETYDAQMSRNMLLALRFLQTKVTLIAQFWFQACIVLQEQTSEIMRHEYTTRIYGDWRLTGDEIYAYIDCIFALNGELFVNKWINDGLIFLPDDDDGEEDHSDHGVESNDDEEEDDDEKDSDDEHKEDADEETEEDKRDHEEEDADDEMEEVGGLEDDAWESPLL